MLKKLDNIAWEIIAAFVIIFIAIPFCFFALIWYYLMAAIEERDLFWGLRSPDSWKKNGS